MARFTHLDLFSGIAGFAKAVEWAGGETIGFVEWDAWCRRVLAKHYPGAHFHGDVRTITSGTLRSWGIATIDRELSDTTARRVRCGIASRETGWAGRGDTGRRIDLLTGGYPCQPFSLAGKRMGHEDDRHLWPEMRRIIGLCRPRFILAENVYGHLTMGLDTVLSDMEADGYTAGALIVPACAVDALHKRDRIWILATANTNGDGREQLEEFRARARQGDLFAAFGDDAHGSDRAETASIPDAGRAERRPGNSDRCGSAGECDLCANGPEGANRPRQRGEGVADAGSARSTRTANRIFARRDAATARGTGIGTDPDAIGERLEGIEHAGATAGPTLGNGAREETARPMGTRAYGIRSDVVRRSSGRSAPRARHGGARLSRLTQADLYALERAQELERTLSGAVGSSTDLSPLYGDPDAIRAAWRDGSWEADLARTIDLEPQRRQKLQAAGNAIVPILAYELIRAIPLEEAADGQ